MKAIILAGGKGTRLAPYTTVLPKPLMPIGEMPILEIMLHQLKVYGFSEVVLCVGYLGSLLKAYFGDGEKIGIRISYSFETAPLGTAGPLRGVQGLDCTFFVMNGDLLTTVNFSQMLRFHRSHGQIATVGLARKVVKIDLGVIETSSDHALVNYIEKPEFEYDVSMGIYVFEPSVLQYLGKERLDLPDLIMQLVREKKIPMAYRSNCRWLDIGRVEDYSNAIESFEKEKEIYLLTDARPEQVTDVDRQR